MNRLTSDEEALIIKRLNPNLIGVAAKQYIKLYEYENLGTLEELKKLKIENDERLYVGQKVWFIHIDHKIYAGVIKKVLSNHIVIYCEELTNFSLGYITIKKENICTSKELAEKIKAITGEIKSDI